MNYRKPVPIDAPIDLRARVAEFTERKAIVACTVTCRGVVCAEAQVVAVRMPVPQPADREAASA